jgi:hypothetical protein
MPKHLAGMAGICPVARQVLVTRHGLWNPGRTIEGLKYRGRR